MARKQNFNYFDSFVDIAEFACQSALLAESIFNNYHPDEMNYYLEKLHGLEHSADEKNHTVSTALAREFIPPLEIEDISDIASKLDDVVDYIEDIGIKLFSYNVKAIRPEAKVFVNVMYECCMKLKEAAQEFSNYKKSEYLNSYVIEVNNLESKADQLYMRALHDLHSGKEDPIDVLVWSRMFEGLEKVCDTCEDAANMLYHVAMKNC
jgi:uncharacterized protein Yka (UPF0111/DUF47 family)